MGAADVLAAWDSVRASPFRPHWTERNVVLLRALRGSGAGEAVRSVGQQQAELLRVYAENADRLDGVARCPGCATDVELSLPVDDLIAGVSDAAPIQPIEPLVAGGPTVHWRLPSRADIADAATCLDADRGAVLLMSRCVVGPKVPAADLDAPLRAVLAERIAAADPFLDIVLTLSCPECALEWDSGLDVGEFVLAWLRSRAHQVLRDVDELARAYGWSEGQILALSDGRRNAYLELVRDG